MTSDHVRLNCCCYWILIRTFVLDHGFPVQPHDFDDDRPTHSDADPATNDERPRNQEGNGKSEHQQTVR